MLSIWPSKVEMVDEKEYWQSVLLQQDEEDDDEKAFCKFEELYCFSSVICWNVCKKLINCCVSLAWWYVSWNKIYTCEYVFALGLWMHIYIYIYIYLYIYIYNSAKVYRMNWALCYPVTENVNKRKLQHDALSFPSTRILTVAWVVWY